MREDFAPKKEEPSPTKTIYYVRNPRNIDAEIAVLSRDDKEYFEGDIFDGPGPERLREAGYLWTASEKEKAEAKEKIASDKADAKAEKERN